MCFFYDVFWQKTNKKKKNSTLQMSDRNLFYLGLWKVLIRYCLFASFFSLCFHNFVSDILSVLDMCGLK